MNKFKYTAERAQQILISLLKEHGIKRVIASPGTTNLTFVVSIQNDPFFEIYSAVDERSAAYMACGMAAETGEPVVITCTGATASRNYIPGLTEAFYSKLPILAVTANSGIQNRGHLIAQQLDRSQIPVDVALMSVDIPVVKDDTEAWLCNVNINKAILELSHNGGGPVHINISTTYCKDFSIKELPLQRVINRITIDDAFPSLDGKKVVVFIGKHRPFNAEETATIERFCEQYNSVVFGDHTSGYNGKYFLSFSSVLIQPLRTESRYFDVMIHLGEISGDYPSMGLQPKEVWRVSLDGTVKDPFHRLRYIFELSAIRFFMHYTKDGYVANTSFYNSCKDQYEHIYTLIPELPFGNIWMAKYLVSHIPEKSEVHLGILNTLRSWNFFQTTTSIQTTSNVGGFGIDGVISTTIGASLTNSERLYYCIIGDLAFFYDLNSIANRHVGNNLRILLINNGHGTEFTNYGHLGHMLGEEAEAYIAAEGHFGKKSKRLVKHIAEDLGFTYISASDKDGFLLGCKDFLNPKIGKQSIIFEVFTDSRDESSALEIMHNLLKPEPSKKQIVKNAIKSVVGETAIEVVKKIVKS